MGIKQFAAGVGYIGFTLDAYNFVICVKNDGIVTNAEVLNGSQLALSVLGLAATAATILLGGWVVVGAVAISSGISLGIAVYGQTVDPDAPHPWFN